MIDPNGDGPEDAELLNTQPNRLLGQEIISSTSAAISHRSEADYEEASTEQTVCTTCGGSGEIDERMGGIATSGIVPCPDCDGQPAEVDATARTVMERVIAKQRQQIADLEAKLDAERTLRAQASAELEREKARERDRRLEADAAARDRLWAIDTLVEALVPLAGYATEEDGRVAGMTNPVSLAMSSVRRADALVKLHRALRR